MNTSAQNTTGSAVTEGPAPCAMPLEILSTAARVRQTDHVHASLKCTFYKSTFYSATCVTVYTEDQLSHNQNAMFHVRITLTAHVKASSHSCN